MKKKYKDLEITCLGKKTHTGEDVDIMLNGEKIKVDYLEWEIGPVDWNNGFGYLEIGTVREGIKTINYAIKKIELQFKAFDIISDNTSLGTKMIRNDKDITSELTAIKLKWFCNGKDRINTLMIEMC